MTLIQSNPTEIRELNIDNFRLDLRALEAAEDGILWLHTHDHVAPIDVGGVTLARVVEIVNGYTVTCEDDQYAVNIVGGNSNIGDNVNVNQVSVRSANSAGLISNAAIEFSSFNEGVTIDVNSGFAGTTFPVGTLQAPVNNLADAKLIATVRGFDLIYIYGDFTFTATDNIDNFTIKGQSHIKTTLTLEDGASTINSEFENATITGVLDGNASVTDCLVQNLTYVEGNIYDCVLTGTVTLAGTSPTRIIGCADGDPDGFTPTFDMGGGGRDLVIAQYSGDVKVTNLSSPQYISIDLNSGVIWLDSTVTSGFFYLRGVGSVYDDSTNTTIYKRELVNVESVANQVWDETMADHLIAGTTGKKLYDGGTGDVDTDAIAAAVWDMVIYPDHVIDDTAGKYIYEFYSLVQTGDVYVSTSTSSEILMVRDRLGDAGVLITETVIDEEAISTDIDTVFPAERLIYDINGVWLSSDTTHASTNYYDGGSFDPYTGQITLNTSLPADNTDVLLNYTFMRGLPDNVIDQFLVEAKLYVKRYTRKDFDWSLGLGADPDEETQIALLAATSIAAMRCLEAIATGDILQFGYQFRLGDLSVESMTSGGFHVQAHIDFLKGDVERKLAILGRAMHFVARTTRRWGRDAHGYKRQAGGKRSVY